MYFFVLLYVSPNNNNDKQRFVYYCGFVFWSNIRVSHCDTKSEQHLCVWSSCQQVLNCFFLRFKIMNKLFEETLSFAAAAVSRVVIKYFLRRSLTQKMSALSMFNKYDTIDTVDRRHAMCNILSPNLLHVSNATFPY